MPAALTLLIAWFGLVGAAAAAGNAAGVESGNADSAAPNLTFVWEDRFSAADQARLERWIITTQSALERLVGPMPMGVQVHFHRRDGAGEPVPWANTQRGRRQAVHLHVDPSFPLDALLADWTAPHELSHLILPYVGRRNAWFAEGFASYLQYRVMQQMGALTPAEAAARYRRHVERAAARYAYPDRPFTDAAPRLRADRQYPVMYWGGAVYFEQVDASLNAQGSGLLAVLREYVACCRRDRQNLRDLLEQLDRLAGGDAFAACYGALARNPGFPDSPAGR